MTVSAPALAERYGTPSRARRPLVLAVIAILVVTGGAWLAWTTVFHSQPQVTSQLVAYDVRGQHRSTATYTVVRRNGDVEASCLLQAVAADHSVVGEKRVPVTSGPLTAQITSTLRTERAATNVQLVGCTAQDQARSR